MVRKGRDEDREIDNMIQEYINPNVAVAEARPQDLAPVPADREGTRSLINELLESFEVETPKESEKIEEVTQPLVEIKKDLYLERDLANLMVGTVITRQTIYMPTIYGFSKLVWTDYKICSAEFVQHIRRNLDVLLNEIRDLLKAFMQNPEDQKIREQLKSRLATFFKTIQIGLNLYVHILYRIIAARSLDLPPQYRSSLANIQMLRIDFLLGRRFYAAATQKRRGR